MAAGGAIIGALRVILGADTADFEKGLKSAQSSLSGFGSTATKIAAALGGALSFGGAVAAVKGTINTLDNLSKTSQKIGVPVEQLSALRHAASLSDVSVESLDKGIAKLARNMVEAAQGSETPKRAFEALGISVRNSDGSFKSMGELLPDIAEKFSRMPDGPVKTALAMQLLGRAGADLIPLLNSGKAGLLDMTNEARQLGLVIGAETGAQAEAFNDNLTRLGAVLRGVLIQTVANILPALANLSQYLIDGAKNSGFLNAAVNALTMGFNAIARAAIVLYDNVKPIAALLAIWVGSGVLISLGSAAISLGLAFVKLTTATRVLGLTMAAFEAIRAISARGLLFIAGVVALASGAFDNFSEKIKGIGNWLTTVLPEGSGERAQQILKDLGLNLDGLTADLKSWQGTAAKSGGGLFNPDIIDRSKDAVQKLVDNMKKATAAAEAEYVTIGQSNVVMQQAKLVSDALATAKANHINMTPKLRAEIEAWALSQALANEKLAIAKGVFEQTRTPLEQYRAEIERLNLAFDNGQTNSALYARGVAAAQQKFIEADPYARAFGQSLESAFGRAIEGGAKFSDVLRSLLQDLTKALANEAFRSLLYGPKGGTGGGLLGGIFGGLIKMFGGGGGADYAGPADNKFGFAKGGSFRVGGSGGIDSQLVSFRASPNERVSITKPNQSFGGSDVKVYPPAGVETTVTKRRDTSSGRELVEIRQMVRREVVDTYGSGDVDAVMRARNGIGRSLRNTA